MMPVKSGLSSDNNVSPLQPENLMAIGAEVESNGPIPLVAEGRII